MAEKRRKLFTGREGADFSAAFAGEGRVMPQKGGTSMC